MIRTQTNRFLRARKISQQSVSKDDDGSYVVASESGRRKGRCYNVYRTMAGVWLCTCMDFVMTRSLCKHILRVKLMLS
jgi:hypothetical protein